MIYFISDLHLSPQKPGIAAIFEKFLQDIGRLSGVKGASKEEGLALYILGDLFDFWVGDEEINAHKPIISALARATSSGLKIYVMHGNRDFLLGDAFAKATGVVMLSDPYVLSAFGWQFVLSHGDALCTDDVEYQKFREETRRPEWQKKFLTRPLSERYALAKALREQSEIGKSGKPDYLMDLNLSATEDFLRQHGYATMIHGHTHRPMRHEHLVDGIQAVRWVLAEWKEEEGEALVLDQGQLSRQRLVA